MRQTLNINRSKWLLYLFIGWGAAVLGLFIAIGVATLLINLNTPDWVWQFTQAIIFTCLVLLVMFWLQKKMSINIWEFIRLTSFKNGFYQLLIGMFIPVLLVGLGVIIGHLLGLITFQGFNFSINLFIAIIINMVIAFLYEAFPEEIILRGYVYSVLRERMGRFLSVLLQTILFVLFPIALTGLQSLFGMDTSPITPAYIILIFTFGIALMLVRLLTGNLWASIGFHLAYLEIARFVVPQGEHTYMKGIQSLIIYDELEPGIGTVFLLLCMIILMTIVIGTILSILKKKKKST